MPGARRRRDRAGGLRPTGDHVALALTLLCAAGLLALMVASTLLDVAAQGLEGSGAPWQGADGWTAARLATGDGITPALLLQRSDRLRELAGPVAIAGLLAALCVPDTGRGHERDGGTGQRPAASTMSNGAA